MKQKKTKALDCYTLNKWSKVYSQLNRKCVFFLFSLSSKCKIKKIYLIIANAINIHLGIGFKDQQQLA